MGTKLRDELTELRFYRTYEKMRGRDVARIDKELSALETKLARTMR